MSHKKWIEQARADIELALANMATEVECEAVGDKPAASASHDAAARQVERALISLNWATGRDCREGLQ